MRDMIVTLETLADRMESRNGRIAGVLWRQARRVDVDGAEPLARDDLEAAALEAFDQEWKAACYRLPKPRTGAENVARVKTLGRMREQLTEGMAAAFAGHDPHEWPTQAGAVVRRHVVARR